MQKSLHSMGIETIMEISFTLKYDDGTEKFDGLDQYHGALSMFGFSQAAMISLNAFLHKEIITQAPSAKGFRLILGRAKEGSWEQVINLVVTDPETLKTLADFGKNAIYDLLKWAIGGAVGIPFIVKTRKAQKRIRELEADNEDLQEKLDKAIIRAHSPVKHQGLKLHIMSGRQNLITFDEATLRYIETEVVHEESFILPVAVTRFNTRTGTGRFVEKMDGISIPFVPNDKLSKNSKRILADNLAMMARGRFETVDAMVSRITSSDDLLKRYIFYGIANIKE